jgi:hypothetical protein
MQNDSKQQQITPVDTQVPASWEEAAARVLKAASEGPMAIIKFKKGHYFNGEREVPLKTRYLAYCDAWACGWTKFIDGQPVERNFVVVATVAENKVPDAATAMGLATSTSPNGQKTRTASHRTRGFSNTSCRWRISKLASVFYSPPHASVARSESSSFARSGRGTRNWDCRRSNWPSAPMTPKSIAISRARTFGSPNGSVAARPSPSMWPRGPGLIQSPKSRRWKFTTLTSSSRSIDDDHGDRRSIGGPRAFCNLCVNHVCSN